MLKQAYDGYAGSLTKQWKHDRSKSVGSSEIGLCARKVFATKFEGTKKGVPRDEDYEDEWGARIRGTVMEESFWYPAMKYRYGDNLIHAGPNQKTLIKDYLSSTPDAIIINQPKDSLKHLGISDIGYSGSFLAECKTIDPRTSLVEAKSENFIQTQVQLGLMRECSPYHPDVNVLTYTDASFWSEVIEFPTVFNEKLYDIAKQRATVIMESKNFGDLKPEGWIAGGKECSFCPFVGACGVERMNIPKNTKKASPALEAEIRTLAEAANTIETSLERLNSGLNEIKDTIKVKLAENGVRRIEGVINWYGVKGKTYYKQNAMKDRLIELGCLRDKLIKLGVDKGELLELDIDIEEFTGTAKNHDRLVISAIPADAAEPVLSMPGRERKKKRNVKTENSKQRKAKGKRGSKTIRGKNADGRTDRKSRDAKSKRTIDGKRAKTQRGRSQTRKGIGAAQSPHKPKRKPSSGSSHAKPIRRGRT